MCERSVCLFLQRIFWFNLNRITFLLLKSLSGWWVGPYSEYTGEREIAGNSISLWSPGASQGRVQHAVCTAEPADSRPLLQRPRGPDWDWPTQGTIFCREFFPKAKNIIENGFEENVYKYRHNVTSLSQCLILQNGLPCSWLEAGVCSMPRLAQPRPACSMQHPLQPLQARAAPVPGYWVS